MATIVTMDEAKTAKARFDSLSAYEVSILLNGLDYLIEVEEEQAESGEIPEILTEARNLRSKLGR